MTILDGEWKLDHPNKRGGEPELHDIKADPGERTDLAKNHPDIVRRLSDKIEAWQATLPKRYDKGDDED